MEQQSSPTVFTRLQKLSNGFSIPQVGFGCYQVLSGDPFFWAIKYGYRHLDTAACYDNEVQVGEAVRRAVAELGLRREELMVTSKVMNDHMGYELTKKSAHESLRKLDVGYLDVMLVHFPGTEGLPFDDPRHAENRKGSWRALEEFVDSGLIRSIGVSNYRPHHLEELMAHSRIKPVINQVELHPLYVEQDTIDACRKHGILVQAYSPFAQGKARLLEHPVLLELSAKHRLNVGRVILLWHLAKDFNVLPKSATEARVRDNILLDGLSLDPEDVARIDEMGRNESFKVEWDPKEYK